ncbi:hypothetical protein AAG570_004351 [Ranatra chinensis]|uniref:C2H2-type domain-containing protein n=1 Tax=Ranatra chinensis TaxID=642074 RepID=A0ABD0Y0W2_9HEMI
MCPKCGLPSTDTEHDCGLPLDPEGASEETSPDSILGIKLPPVHETPEVVDYKQCLNAKNYLETFDIGVQDCGESTINGESSASAKGGDSDSGVRDKLVCQCCCVVFPSEYEKQLHLKSVLTADQIQGNNDGGDEDLWLLSEELETQNLFKEINQDIKISRVDEIVEKVSKEVEHVCRICDIPFISLSILDRHLKVHERSKGPVDCTVCGYHCHDQLHLQYHHREQHSTLPSRYVCVLCDGGFQSNKELKAHLLREHPNIKHYSCRECGQKFKRYTQLENHKQYTHGNATCRVCSKKIEDPVKLRQHELRHARIDSKKFDCSECGRSFKSPGGLRVHRVSHTGDYKFFCEFCGRGFMSSVPLEEHKGVHTKEERYICDTCGRKFVLYSTFHLHRQWHSNPFPFPCTVCGRKFKYRSERSNHVRKCHTGEHPHKCPHCSAQFIKAAYLKRHLSMHTNEYPFNCHHCHKGFEQRRGLARHLATIHKDMTLIQLGPQKCQYKVALRPDEYPPSKDEESMVNNLPS